MALTTKATGMVLGGIVGLAMAATNPNCEAEHIKDPISCSQRYVLSDNGYRYSGVGYVAGSALAMFCVGGLVGLALRGQLKE